MNHKISGKIFLNILLRVFPRAYRNLWVGGLSGLKIRLNMWENVATVQTEIEAFWVSFIYMCPCIVNRIS